MVNRAENSHGGSVSKKPKKKSKYTPSNYTTGKQAKNGGYDPYNVSRPKGYNDPYIYGAPRAVRNAPAEAKARNRARRTNSPAPQRVARQTTIQATPRNRPGNDLPDRGQRVGGGGGNNLLDQMMNSLMVDSASSTFDYEQALKESSAAIRQAYAAELGAIRSNNRAATRDTRKGRQELESMFNGLAATYGRDAQASRVRGNRDAKGMQAIADETNKGTRQTFNQISKEEKQMLQDLGQGDTADQIIAPDFAELKKVTGENKAHGARKAQEAKAFNDADARFFERGGSSARFEGKQRSGDLLASLNEFLRQSRSQIAGIKGNRARELAQNKQSVMQAVSEAQAKSDAELWERMQDVANLKLKIEDTQFDNNLDASQFAYQQRKDDRAFKEKRNQFQASLNAKNTSKSLVPSNIQNAMGLIRSNGQQKQKLASIMDQLFRTDPFVQGKVVKPGKGGKNTEYKLSPFAAANLAEQAGRQAGLSARDIATLRLAAMASVK